MLKQDVDTLKSLIREYGTLEAVSGLIIALRNSADEYSDMGLKERAIEASQLSNVLEEVVAVGLELRDELSFADDE